MSQERKAEGGTKWRKKYSEHCVGGGGEDEESKLLGKDIVVSFPLLFLPEK